MHDVDLIPINPQLKYSFPEEGNALHIASPETHPKYHYDKFVGGILVLTSKDFQKLNGLSNRYWGWGLEDDEFYLRMKQGGIKVIRPENIKTGTKDTFRWVHQSINWVNWLDWDEIVFAGTFMIRWKEVVTWPNALIRRLLLANVTELPGWRMYLMSYSRSLPLRSIHRQLQYSTLCWTVIAHWLPGAVAHQNDMDV